MHLLLVTPYYAPDLGPSSPLLSQLCENLVAVGDQVTVIATVPHFPSGHVAPEYRKRAWFWEDRNGVRVCRVWVPSGDRANLRHRLLTFIVYQILCCWVGLPLKYNVAFVINPAIETFLPFALLVWLRRKPSIFGVWDLYPEVGIRLGIFRHPIVIRAVKLLEDFCLRHATIVQSLSDGFVTSLRARVKNPDQLVVIPPWLDVDFIRPLPRRSAFSREYCLDDSFIILYAGNLGFSQGLENVLMAAQLLSTQPYIQFVFVGDGAQRQALMAQAQQLELVNVRFIPFQPRERLGEVLASADVCLVCLKPGVGDDALPSKTFPILASGRPILAAVDQDSSIARLIAQAQAGFVIPPAIPEKLADAILNLTANLPLCQQLGASGRDYVVRFHSDKIATQEFRAVLQRISA